MFKWLTALRTIVESCSDPAKSCWEPAKSEQCTYRAEAGNSRIGWEEGWKAGFDNSRPSSVLLLGGVQPCSAFNWRGPFGDTFRSTRTFSKAFWWLFEAIRITGWGLLIFWLRRVALCFPGWSWCHSILGGLGCPIPLSTPGW